MLNANSFQIADSLASAFLSGSFDVDSLVRSGSEVLGKQPLWLRPLAVQLVSEFANDTHPRQRTLTRFIRADRRFRKSYSKGKLKLAKFIITPATMHPVTAAEQWQVPPICTAGELAGWLEISPGELDWFADRRQLEAKMNNTTLRHYHYRPLAKRTGRIRLIESPKPRLKVIQRCILNRIIEKIPVHDAAHGFCQGRSIKTFAVPHTGKRTVLRLDLEDFFPSVSLTRIQSLFRTIGYPETVADLLAGLCTNSVPSDVWGNVHLLTKTSVPFHVRQMYRQPHLPQGAPTSPALANLCAFKLDCRLAGLAEAAGATYTRYADDLAFSGNDQFDRVVKRFQLHVCATLIEEEFTPHYHKTKIMRQGVQQHLAGLVINEHVNVRRLHYDRLKATLTNCIRHGAASQNRAGLDDFRSHLLGRVTFIESIHPKRGQRLRRLFDQINW